MDKHFELDTINMLAATIVDDTIKGAKAGTEKAVMIQTAAYKLAGHIRKPSDDDKSVPARCEEAYNEALDLLASAARIITKIKEFDEPTEWLDDRRDFINKPNPFKEADIVHDGETEPTLLPFSLEEAKNGAKVVTRDRRSVKIVEESLIGEYPILAVIERKDERKDFQTYRVDGYSHSSFEGTYISTDDLFILKEPETIEINIFRNKFDGTYSTSAYESKALQGEELIKTIKTTI